MTGRLVALCKAHDDGNDGTLARAIDAIEIDAEHMYITLFGMTSKLVCMFRIFT